MTMMKNQGYCMQNIMILQLTLQVLQGEGAVQEGMQENNMWMLKEEFDMS